VSWLSPTNAMRTTRANLAATPASSAELAGVSGLSG